MARRHAETPVERARALLARSQHWYNEANRILQTEFDKVRNDYNELYTLAHAAPDCVTKALMLIRLREMHEAAVPLRRAA